MNKIGSLLELVLGDLRICLLSSACHIYSNLTNPINMVSTTYENYLFNLICEIINFLKKFLIFFCLYLISYFKDIILNILNVYIDNILCHTFFNILCTLEDFMIFRLQHHLWFCYMNFEHLKFWLSRFTTLHVLHEVIMSGYNPLRHLLLKSNF